jgi:hypothetical protein
MSPPNTRFFIRRKIDMSIGCIKNAQAHIVEVAQPFEVTHKDYYEAFCMIVSALETIIPTIESIKDKI